MNIPSDSQGAWFLSFTVIILRFTCAAMYINSPCFFITKSNGYITIRLTIRLLMSIWILVVITNKAAVNISMQVSSVNT